MFVQTVTWWCQSIVNPYCSLNHVKVNIIYAIQRQFLHSSKTSDIAIRCMNSWSDVEVGLCVCSSHLRLRTFLRGCGREWERQRNRRMTTNVQGDLCRQTVVSVGLQCTHAGLCTAVLEVSEAALHRSRLQLCWCMERGVIQLLFGIRLPACTCASVSSQLYFLHTVLTSLCEYNTNSREHVTASSYTHTVQ